MNSYAIIEDDSKLIVDSAPCRTSALRLADGFMRRTRQPHSIAPLEPTPTLEHA